MTYLPIPIQPSCAQAWLAATSAINSLPGHEAHNVVIGVEGPTTQTTIDTTIVAELDAFLGAHKKPPVKTVANTIFPQWTYDLHGSPAFYDVYMQKVFPRVKSSPADWGRYFERMISFPVERKGKPINPLRDIVDKMKKQVESDRTFRNVYELTVYDPVRDAGPNRNRQCLSFLSFKLSPGPERRLLLTAMYRNHYYIERLLGNLIGLGRLMRFVATETGVAVGALTVVSTHAEVDAVGTRPKIGRLLKACEKHVNGTPDALNRVRRSKKKAPMKTGVDA